MLAPAVDSLPAIAAQAENGAPLFRVAADGEAIGYYLLRVDYLPEGAEGVIVAAAGRPGFDLAEMCLPYIEGQFKGCKSLRVHTARPGLVRKLAGVGWRPMEFVMKKDLMQ